MRALLLALYFIEMYLSYIFLHHMCTWGMQSYFVNHVWRYWKVFSSLNVSDTSVRTVLLLLPPTSPSFEVTRLPTAILTFLPRPVSNFPHVSNTTVFMLCVTEYPTFFSKLCWIPCPFHLIFYLFCHGFRSPSFETCLGLLEGVRIKYFETENLVYISVNCRLKTFGRRREENVTRTFNWEPIELWSLVEGRPHATPPRANHSPSYWVGCSDQEPRHAWGSRCLRICETGIIKTVDDKIRSCDRILSRVA